MRKKTKKNCVCCPACGSIVFKGTVTDSEHVCPKCNTEIGVWMKDGIVLVYDRKNESREENTAYRLSSYLDSLAGSHSD